MTTRPLPSLDRRAFIRRLAAGLVGAIPFLHGKSAESASASSGPFIGEIMLIAGSYAPDGWALCNGQFLPIQNYQALFSLLGFTYGGSGAVFALPDLRDRVPMHFGEGPGLLPRTLGERAGAATHLLTLAEIPAHSHLIRASSAFGSSVTPNGMYPARNPAQHPQYRPSPDVVMSPSAIGAVGGGQSHTNMQPCLGLNFCIALQGIFPSQS